MESIYIMKGNFFQTFTKSFFVQSVLGLTIKDKSVNLSYLLKIKEAPPRFELGNRGFADLCLTTWPWRPNKKAGNETRTRDSHLGKVVLYQLSYSRLTN